MHLIPADLIIMGWKRGSVSDDLSRGRNINERRNSNHFEFIRLKFVSVKIEVDH